MNRQRRPGVPGTRTVLQTCLLAGFVALMSGCGPDVFDDLDTLNTDDTSTGFDAVEWDPGNPGTECGGYGYGYGPDCVPEGALDCTQDPCIFGNCVLVSGVGTCVCLEGYDGRICGECAEGWVARGLRCVRLDVCDGYTCAFGTCRILNTQPFCDCDIGYTGDHCDVCADGFVPMNLRCVEEE
ncbi:MAG TPA: hypothetical protein PKK50_02550 [Myxococcota bacterium]|nr:hypothetical protein [Myxococcota bacterium]